MALELNNTTGGKKDQTESLHQISGADDVRLIQAGETLTSDDIGPIVGVVPQEDTVFSSLKAGDSGKTDVIGADDGGGNKIGYKNMSSQTIKQGALITPGRYELGRYFSEVGVTSGSALVYYNYTVQD